MPRGGARPRRPPRPRSPPPRAIPDEAPRRRRPPRAPASPPLPIGLVLEVGNHIPTRGVIAHGPEEQYDGAGAGIGHEGDQRRGVDRRLRDLNVVPAGYL